MEKINFAIFVSGSGTNCENLIRYFASSERYHCALVVSNKPDALALTKAERLGVPTAITPKPELNDKEVMMPLLQQYGIQFIVLAGFLPLIPDFLIESYPRRIINIHPALLPAYGGKGMYGHHVHEAVVANHEHESGITIHIVDNHYDRGTTLFQARCTVTPEDTPDTLAAKIHLLEKEHFPRVIDETIKAHK